MEVVEVVEVVKVVKVVVVVVLVIVSGCQSTMLSAENSLQSWAGELLAGDCTTRAKLILFLLRKGELDCSRLQDYLLHKQKKQER